MQYHQLLYASPPSYYNFLQKKKKKNHFQIVIYIRCDLIDLQKRLYSTVYPPHRHAQLCTIMPYAMPNFEVVKLPRLRKGGMQCTTFQMIILQA